MLYDRARDNKYVSLTLGADVENCHFVEIIVLLYSFNLLRMKVTILVLSRHNRTYVLELTSKYITP